MMTKRPLSQLWTEGKVALLAALGLLAIATWSAPADAQGCPSAYSACDNGGCCLNSDQCCPTLEGGCCALATPFCCGDGTCAASPPECANAGRNTCIGYDIPCGKGCAPAGSHCCDPIGGYYCPPQGICTTETTCRAGNEGSTAKLVVPTSPIPSASLEEQTASPLVDPANGTERSCALVSGVVPFTAVPFGVLSLVLGAGWLRRRRP